MFNFENLQKPSKYIKEQSPKIKFRIKIVFNIFLQYFPKIGKTAYDMLKGEIFFPFELSSLKILRKCPPPLTGLKNIVDAFSCS